MEAAVADRDATAQRAASIEVELEQVRKRLADVEPAEQAQAEEIRELERERDGAAGQARASSPSARRELRARRLALRRARGRAAARSRICSSEAVEDLGQKESVIQGLQDRLKRAAKSEPAPARGGKQRGWDQLERRLRTLYGTSRSTTARSTTWSRCATRRMKLTAEEAIKRLADDSDTAAIRRKVGGLPPHLSIFELGFAGKGRIYYTRGRQRAFRVLSVGAKNTQNADLEYLSRPAGLSAAAQRRLQLAVVPGLRDQRAHAELRELRRPGSPRSSR